jgi:hypothetical protein
MSANVQPAHLIYVGNWEKAVVSLLEMGAD